MDRRHLNLIAPILLISSLVPTLAQTSTSTQVSPRGGQDSPITDIDRTTASRRFFAMSLLISLAKDAASYSDLALRPRVLARAADMLWDSDKDNARELFLKAWEAAEQGDAEQVTIKTRDNPPPMVIALRRLSGYDLRSEVLSLIATRDAALAEEFLNKLKTDTERKADRSNSTRPSDNWSASESDSKRLQIAGRLLQDGFVNQAIGIAGPALCCVNEKSINFLSEVRKRSPGVADQSFSGLLNRIALDPTADANTISGLSSYIFTPGVYMTFSPDGGSLWTPSEHVNQPQDLQPAIRSRFLQLASTVLLKRLPHGEEDSGSAGRRGTVNVIRRLLPFFDQYAPDTAPALRSYLTEWTTLASGNNANPLLAHGLKDDHPVDLLKDLQEQIDRSKSSFQRDRIYATIAFTLADQGDLKAREIAGKIEDSEQRLLTSQLVDFQLIQGAVTKRKAGEAIRLAETGQLTPTQRAIAYTQAARVLIGVEPDRHLEILEKALAYTMRIENGSTDQAVLLVGISLQLLPTNRTRAWEVMGQLVQAGNSAESFNGENIIRFTMPVRGAIKTTEVGGENFSLYKAFGLLAHDDLYRAIDLSKSFKYAAPMANATLAICGSILKKKNPDGPRER